MQLNEDISNFMETLVGEEFSIQGLGNRYDNDYIQDLFCLTLNQLRPHYVRNTIDVRINISAEERAKIAKSIIHAIDEGHKILQSGRRSGERD